jgi:hypothetical protein
MTLVIIKINYVLLQNSCLHVDAPAALVDLREILFVVSVSSLKIVLSCPPGKDMKGKSTDNIFGHAKGSLRGIQKAVSHMFLMRLTNISIGGNGLVVGLCPMNLTMSSLKEESRVMDRFSWNISVQPSFRNQAIEVQETLLFQSAGLELGL